MRGKNGTPATGAGTSGVPLPQRVAPVPSVTIVGPGRAGRSLAIALTDAGWPAPTLLGRGDDLRSAARGADLLVLATPDRAIAAVATTVEPDPGTTVVHLAGSLCLDVLAPHVRRASIHPLVALPTPAIG